MNNKYFYKLKVSAEQIQKAEELVEYSVENHPVTDVYKNDKADTYGLDGDDRKKEYRFVGTLGEIVFADFYSLPRPNRSYGAIDGQDHGKDNLYDLGGQKVAIDIKTMHRNARIMCDYYVLDLPVYQTQKTDSVTDYYFHITLQYERGSHNDITALLIGFISKDEVQNLGEYFEAGSQRENDFGNYVLFSRDTYEVMLGDIHSPWEPAIGPENLSSVKYHLKMTDKYKERREALDKID